MADPISKIGVKAVVPNTADTPGLTTGKKFDAPKIASEKAASPEATVLNPPDRKQMEQDLRRRIESTGSQNPSLLFGPDMTKMGDRIQALNSKRVPPTVRAELEKIESRFQASQSKLGEIPDANNLRDLLKMQTEMYEMNQNVELLTKLVDSTTSGVKQTLQMQV